MVVGIRQIHHPEYMIINDEGIYGLSLHICIIDLVSRELVCDAPNTRVVTSGEELIFEEAPGNVFIVRTNSGFRSICSGSEFAGFFVWGASSYTVWIPGINKVSCWAVRGGFKRICMNTYLIDSVKTTPPCYLVDKLSTLYMLPVIITSNAKPRGGEWKYNILSLGKDCYLDAIYDSIEKYTIYHGLNTPILSKIIAKIITSQTISNKLVETLRKSLENNALIINSIDKDIYSLKLNEQLTITLLKGKLLIEEE